jgi:hypothetical protein
MIGGARRRRLAREVQRMSWHALFDNLGAPVPFWTKLRLVLRNSAYKVAHRTNCCGHPGQPGC